MNNVVRVAAPVLKHAAGVPGVLVMNTLIAVPAKTQEEVQNLVCDVMVEVQWIKMHLKK